LPGSKPSALNRPASDSNAAADATGLTSVIPLTISIDCIV